VLSSCSPQVVEGVDRLASSHSRLGVVVLVGIVVVVLSSSPPQVAEGVDMLSSSSHSRLGVVVLVDIVVLVDSSSVSVSVAESPCSSLPLVPATVLGGVVVTVVSVRCVGLGFCSWGLVVVAVGADLVPALWALAVRVPTLGAVGL
jgi:hypothetical protein